MSDADYNNGTKPGLVGDFGHAGGMQAAAQDGYIKDTTTAGFQDDVIQESRNQPVLVDFWAPWCGPCKQLTPVLEKAVNEAGGTVKLVKMNIDDHPSIPGQLGIQSIPAVIAFRDGQPIDGFMGAVPESQVKEFIGRLGGGKQAPKTEEALAAAAEARAAGDQQMAARIYAMVLEGEPDNADALGGMAEMLLDAGDLDAAKGVLDKAPEDKADAPAIAAVRARIQLAEQAASLGDPAELERRLAENPKDHQARFDLAMIQNVLGDRVAAADNLLHIVKADRSWNDDGARAQLLTFFEAWGPTDEATLQARRKLSSLLFS
ncbi:thioredoxin [Mesorhizobium sp. Z1-4]|uniref:thioredoxin n=1 Tax=Mesorhizobium sp. Z1-4 TaxID=2448478 RepID=UPI000FD8478B|nr:thioredoxin [Mesorhizobium sp. Z1-4]